MSEHSEKITFPELILRFYSARILNIPFRSLEPHLPSSKSVRVIFMNFISREEGPGKRGPGGDAP